MAGSVNGIRIPQFKLLSTTSELSLHRTLYDKDEVICDRYYILHRQETLIGHADIFYCIDIWDNTPCVIKELHVQSGIEARNIAKIPFHQNVVRLLRLEVIGGSILMVMEWLPHTLLDVIRKSDDKLSADEITDAIFSICCGLHHCITYLSTQEKMYVHKDIKPDNVFISYDGIFKLADFEEGYTPKYAAPELKNNQSVDYRSDIFSIGMVLKELCSHCEDHVFKEKARPLIEACTQESKDDRPQSLQAICLALGRELVDIEVDIEKDKYTRGGLTAVQLRNLALIGEPYDYMFHDLKEIWDHGDAESLYYAGDVLLRIEQPKEALSLYFKSLNSGGRDNQSIALTKIAQAYSGLYDWDNVIKHSKIALDCMARDYMEKTATNLFDYSAIYLYINAVFNKNTDDSCKGDPLALSEAQPNKELFSWILPFLQWLHEKQPARRETLRLLGYIHYILQEYDEAILYYQEYSSSSKDDYETAFYYAVSLFFSCDTTKAKKQFKFIADFLEASEAMSLGRLIMLLHCKYFLNDATGFKAVLKRFDDNIDPLSNEKPKKTWNQLIQEKEQWINLTKFAVINQLFEDDIQLTSSYFNSVGSIMNALNSDQLQSVSDKKHSNVWYENQLLKIKELRVEWDTLDLPPISLALRHLNFLSYYCEALIFERLGDYEAMLQACDNMLLVDKSSPEALYNKAEALVRLERYIDSVPLYRQSFEMHEVEQRKNEVKRREKEILIYLHENPDEFYTRLLNEAPEWGVNPAKLKYYISNYGIMFSNTIFSWLSEYTEALIRDVAHDKRHSHDVMPVLCLLRILQHLNVPELLEEDKEPLKNYTPYRNVEYHFSRLTNFKEVAHHILTTLIDAADKYQLSDWLFNILPIRGANYIWRDFGVHSENLDKAIDDFQRFLNLKTS